MSKMNESPLRAETKSVTVHNLVGGKIGKVAKRVRDQLTMDEEAALLKVKAMGASAALEHLNGLPRPVHDRDVIGCIMALVAGKASEGDFARTFKTIKQFFTEYNDQWLKAARDYCVALLEAKEEAKEERVRHKNNISKDGFFDLRDFALAVLKASGESRPTLFRHGTDVARMSIVKEEDSATIEALSCESFIAAFPGRFVESVGDGKTREAEPYAPVLKNVYHTPEKPLPYLKGFTRFPVFGENGTMQSSAGYSESTMTYYVPPVGLEIPVVGDWKGDKREEDVAEAKRLLIEELLADFPCDEWNRGKIIASLYNEEGSEPLPASLLNLLALLITPFVRPLISGPSPLTLITKPAVGTGATYAAEAIQLIVTGTANARAPLSNSEEERRKVLFTAIMASEPVVLFDNQKGVLDSPTLASALTSNNFTDRVLGKSEERRLPINSSFVMTSNNLGASEELQRRISLVRMDAKMVNPKDRHDWRHKDLHGWIMINRAKLLWAVLTLVQNWITRGCQGPSKSPVVASYVGWSYVLGGILECADSRWTTFQGNRDDIGKFAAGGEEDGVEALISEWYKSGAEDSTSNELAVLMESQAIEIDVVKKTFDGAISPMSLGKHLSSLNGRHFSVDGKEVRLTRETIHKAAKWRLQEVVASGVTVEAAEGEAATEGEGEAAADGAPRPQEPEREPLTYRNFPLFDDPVKVTEEKRAKEAQAKTLTERPRGRGRRAAFDRALARAAKPVEAKAHSATIH